LKKALIGIGVAVVLVAAWGLRLYWFAGEFKKLVPHFDGDCTTVVGAVGAEDIAIHRGTGVAFVSSVDRRAWMAGRPARGAIFLYVLADPGRGLRNLTPDASPDFFPHGISLHVGADGRTTLLVVNHAGGKNTIEVYRWNGESLTHEKTIADPMMVSPNDVHAIDHERFFVTNDHANPPGFARTIEEYLQREISNVLYYDGQHFHEAAGGIGLPNGVNASPDGKTLYVASTITGSIRLFDLDAANGTLTPKGRIEIGSGVDNIDVDADGRLWVAAHPKLLTFVKHVSDPNVLAPSQVFRVDPATKRVDEVFLDLGTRLSGSSVGAFHGGRLLIGPVFDTKFLDCRLGAGS
jgi:arylesterase/paraoxonase